MTIKEKVLKLVQERKAKIGIGLLKPTESVIDSMKRASEYVDIVTVGAEVKGFENFKANQENIEEVECEKLLSGEIEGLIRGQADAFKFEDVLAKKGNYDRTKILGFQVAEDAHGRSFFTTSASHPDGWTRASKQYMVDEILKEMKLLDIKPKIGFLTLVRPGSVGRNFFFDQSWEQAEDLVKYYQDKGLEAKNYNIEIETALDDGVNLVVFGNGASGNMFGRIISFLTKDPYLIYGQIGIDDNVVQNNRTVQNYYNHLLYAAAKANARK